MNHSKQGEQQHKCKVPKCPYRHEHPQQQASWEKRFDELWKNPSGFFPAKVTGGTRNDVVFMPDWDVANKHIKSFISTERQRVINDVRKVILDVYKQKYSHFTRDYRKEDEFKDDLLLALKEMDK